MFKRFAIGFAVGYVLGARAGEQRYKQIKDLAERALESEPVAGLIESGKELAGDQERQLTQALKERVGDLRHRNGRGPSGHAASSRRGNGASSRHTSSGRTTRSRTAPRRAHTGTNSGNGARSRKQPAKKQPAKKQTTRRTSRS
ncbi:MAG TPA: hypothetical protein VIC35_02150 [Acidimicrobiia bacterium]|jgi:hypothetical protein